MIEQSIVQLPELVKDIDLPVFIDLVHLSSLLKPTDRYLNYPQFRGQMCQVSVGTAESTRLPLDEEDRQPIGNWDWGSSAEEDSRERVSMANSLVN